MDKYDRFEQIRDLERLVRDIRSELWEIEQGLEDIADSLRADAVCVDEGWTSGIV